MRTVVVLGQKLEYLLFWHAKLPHDFGSDVSLVDWSSFRAVSKIGGRGYSVVFCHLYPRWVSIIRSTNTGDF